MTDTQPTESVPIVHTIYNCERCFRQFTTEGAPAGQLVLFTAPKGKIVVPDELFQCGTAECDLIFQANMKAEQDDRKRYAANASAWRARHQPKAGRKGKPATTARQSCTVPQRREPYRDNEDDTRQIHQEITEVTESEIQSELNPGATIKAYNFLSAPENFGRWLPNKTIEAAVGEGGSRLNSVMARLRKRLRVKGDFILSLAARQNGTRTELNFYCIHAAGDPEPFLENRQI